MTKPAVAQEAMSYCTSCKRDLNHVIVALKGDKIAKVECLSCKKTHVYRVPKGEAAAKKARTRKAAKAKEAAEKEANSIENEWQKLMNAHHDAPSKTYSMKSHFSLGEKLNHPTFGEGIVGRLIYPNKVEVVFQRDIKILIHAGEKVAV